MRLRSTIENKDGSIEERQGMLIYLMKKLQNKVSTVPNKDRVRFKADLKFISNRSVCEEQKLQQIDSMIGPYNFLGA